MNEEWYDNKALFEMMRKLEGEIACLSKQMTETATVIRDYNSLRGKVDDTAAQVKTLMWLLPVTVAAMGVLFTAISYFL